MRGVFRLLVWLGVIGCIWLGSFVWFVYTIDQYPKTVTTRADGIVVLTGGEGRIGYGLELLALQKGDALFISGVHHSVPLADLMNTVPNVAQTILSRFSEGKVTLGRAATNTIANAEESEAWIIQHNYKSILLVTADYHMPRSLIEFRHTLPDVTFIPAAVKITDYTTLQWLGNADLRNLLLTQFHKFIAAKLRHWLFAPEAENAS